MYTNHFLLIPEFLIEYNYIFNNPINISDSNVTLSSFTNKLDFKKELIPNLNMYFNNLAENKKINPFIDQDYLEKYKSKFYCLNYHSLKACKYINFDEVNTTALFFARNSIIKFISKCFKYSSTDEYLNEINKILEKLEEINNINVSNTLIENAKLINLERLQTENIKILNLYNCKLHKVDEFKSLILMVEELNLSNNNLVFFDMTSVNKNLRIVDLSNNYLKAIENYNEDYLECIEYLDISFNMISDIKIITNFLNFCVKLQKFFFFCNPFKHKILNKIDYDFNSILNEIHRKELLVKLKEYSDEDQNINYTLEVEKQIDKITLQQNLKQFDILYVNYSFTDTFKNFSSMDIFKERRTYHILNK